MEQGIQLIGTYSTPSNDNFTSLIVCLVLSCKEYVLSGVWIKVRNSNGLVLKVNQQCVSIDK